MEFLKNIWLSIIALISGSSQQDSPQVELKDAAPITAQTVVQKNSLKNFHAHIRSKLKATAKISETEKNNGILEEKMELISKILPHLTTEQTHQPEDHTTNLIQSRMFNGVLSSKIQGQLFLGIESSNYAMIKHALDSGASLNQKINGVDPLQYAIRHGNEVIIEHLINQGAIVGQHHISLAAFYKDMYQMALKDRDLKFNEPNSKEKLLNEIDDYDALVPFLEIEAKLQKHLGVQKLLQEKSHTTSSAVTSAAACASSSASAAAAAATANAKIGSPEKNTSAARATEASSYNSKK